MLKSGNPLRLPKMAWKPMPPDPKPPLRQGIGTEGRIIPLRTNYYEVTVEDWSQDLVLYDVVIKEPKRDEAESVISKSRRMMIFETLKVKYPKLFKEYSLAYDGMKAAVSTGIIEEFKDGTKKHQVEVDNNRGKKNRYIIILKVVNRTTLYDLWLFLKRNREFPATVFQLIEIMFRHTPSSKYLSIGQNSFYSFDSEFSRSREISNGIIAGQGFFASLRPAQWKDGSLLLNVDVTHAAFYKEQSLLEFMKNNDIISHQNFMNKTLDEPLSSSAKDTMLKKLKGLKVYVTHTPKKCTCKIIDILDVGADEQRFKVDETRNQTVLEYFMEVYPRFNIRYPKLNLIRVAPITKTVYLPIEYCWIEKGQRVKRRVMDSQESADFISFSAKEPRERQENISNILKRNKFSDDPIMKALGFSFSPKPLELNGRVLPGPELTMKKWLPSTSDTKAATVTPNKGSWDVRQFQFFQGAKIDCWEVVDFSEKKVTKSEISEFVQKLIEMGKDRGMTLSYPSITHCTHQNLQNILESSEKKNPKPEILLVILPSKKQKYYAQVKIIGDRIINIVTQCVLFKNVALKHPATIGNLLNKINTKVGGINNSIENQHRLVLDRPVMIMGADVNHPPASDSSGIPSVAAVVASMDKYASKYAVEVRHQKARLEKIEDLKEMTRNHIQSFYRTVGEIPERIIMYRDGVGESQFLEVLEYELKAMREACLSMDKKYKPGITFIVVQKRHHTRFFPVNEHDGVGKCKNVPPGTVVDTAVTHPHEIDYFLCSHEGIHGTSKPTHYRVLWDDNDFTMDQLQYFSFAICHMYARCSRSVSIPTPAYYAHLAAYRGKVHLHELCGGQGGSLLHGETPPEIPDSVLLNAVKIDKTSKVTKQMYFL